MLYKTTNYDLLCEMLNTIPEGDACLEWVGIRTRNGYGRISVGKGDLRRQVLVHRLAYGLAYGEVPEGLLVCHKCDNRPCFRPSHLFLGTYGDNTRDCIAKGRRLVLSGVSHGMAKLSEDQVREIRALHAGGLAYAAIGNKFSITKSTVGRIIQGIRWKLLT
jgi:hypothetical protein